MRRSIHQFLLISRATALEGLQQPVVLLLTLSSTLLTSLVPLVQLYTFGEPGRLARDSGLSFFLVFGLWILVFTAGFTVSAEMQRGTAATVLAKPVGRTTFLLGKWAGCLGVLTVFATSTLIATLLAERTSEAFVETAAFHGAIVDRYSGLGALAAITGSLVLAGGLHYFRRARFGLSAMLLMLVLLFAVMAGCSFVNRAGEFLSVPSLQLNLRVLPVALLIFLLLALYTAVATSLSTRFGRMTVLAVCGGLLFAGFFVDSLFGASGGLLPRLLYSLVPDVQNFWMADALGQGGRMPLGYVLKAAICSLSYSAAALVMGVVFFRRNLP